MMKNINFQLKVITVLSFIVISSFACQSKKKSNNDQGQKQSVVTVHTFPSDDGWGFEIKIAGKTKIKQSYIPLIQGKTPFDSEIEARRVGELMAERMKKTHQLPKITMNDLDSLQVKY